MLVQGVQENCVVFHEFPLPVLPPPRKDLAAIGCTEIGRPIGVTVHLHCVESFENPLQRYGGEGRVAMDNEKTQFFLNTLYLQYFPTARNSILEPCTRLRTRPAKSRLKYV